MTTTILTNSIAQAIAPLITQGRNAHAGALSIGAAVLLSQNTAAKIGVDLHDFIGDPATPLVLGKQPRYAAQKVALKDAYAAKRDALHAGREFCRLAINLLRPILGNDWNTAWQAAGFHLPSLALPKQPVAMLGAFSAYFGTHAAHENAPAGITAAAAKAAADAIDAAVLAVGAAKSLLVLRKGERDVSKKKLRERLIGLRGELEQLLEDDDGRWYEFGFQRPADGSKPAPVTGLTLLPVGSGTVFATWEASARAQNYRVTWKPTGSSDPATEVGLFAETQATLTSLPAGVPVTIAVTARNGSG